MSKPEPPPLPLVDGEPYVPAYDAEGFDQLGYGEPPVGYRHPHWIAEDRTPLAVLYTEDGFPVIDFVPVPRLRKRRIGWDAARQRAFVAVLAHTPSIGFAARTVGMSPQSFYRLIDQPGAESFAKAVDLAIDHGLMRLRLSSVGRGLGEDEVPVFRRGRHVRTELRHNDRLSIAILRQAGSDDTDRMRHASQSRWRGKQEWARADAEHAAERAAEAALIEEHRKLAESPPRPPRTPRVEML